MLSHNYGSINLSYIATDILDMKKIDRNQNIDTGQPAWLSRLV